MRIIPGLLLWSPLPLAMPLPLLPRSFAVAAAAAAAAAADAFISPDWYVARASDAATLLLISQTPLPIRR